MDGVGEQLAIWMGSGNGPKAVYAVLLDTKL
jgi:hypothetical protein